MTRRTAGWMIVVCVIALVALIVTTVLKESKRNWPPNRDALIIEVEKLRKERNALETRLGHVWIAAAEVGITVYCYPNLWPDRYYVGKEEFALVKFLATDEGESECAYQYPEHSRWGRPDLAR